MPRIVALVTLLASADPATCDRRGLADLVTTSQQVRAWLDALDVRIAIHARRLAEAGACEAPSSLLAGGGRRAAKDAEQAAQRGKVCDLLPEVHDALADGTVSAGHADALARVVNDLDERGCSDLKQLESALVESARTSSVEAFSREVRKLGQILARDDGVRRHEHLRRQRCVRRWVDRVSGLCHTDLSLDPLTEAAVANALGAATSAEQANSADDRTLDQVKADALVALITGACGYLRPVYDDPEFVVRNIYRLYGGWWDGNPATLKPAPEADQAREVATLAGGAARLAERARARRRGDLRLAGHLAEWARLAEPNDESIAETYREVFTRRAEAEPSTMAKNIFGDAADHSGERARGRRNRDLHRGRKQADIRRCRRVAGVVPSRQGRGRGDRHAPRGGPSVQAEHGERRPGAEGPQGRLRPQGGRASEGRRHHRLRRAVEGDQGRS